MTFTYNPVRMSRMDRIRAYIGDTDATAAEDLRLHDEEIELFLDTKGVWEIACAWCCFALSARFARKLEGSSGGLSPSRSRAQELSILGNKMLVLPAGKAASVSLAANSRGAKDLALSDTDRVGQPFWKGMFDHEGPQHG